MIASATAEWRSQGEILRPMPQENVQLVLSLYESVEKGDYGSPLELFAEDVLWDTTRFGLPDLANVYRGHEELRGFWLGWLAAWETIEFPTLATEDLGDHVLVEVGQRNRGRGSGVAVDFHYWQIYSLRDGKVRACWSAATREEALDAAGVNC
jgi:ketosteroid isomerase-like protein